MKYLLDTDIIVDHLRGKKIISEQILRGGASISIITLAELLYGVHKSDHSNSRLDKLRESLWLLNLEVKNLDENIVAEFGRIKAELEKAGTRLEDFDLLIAATAKVLNLSLVSRDTNHFKRIKDLKMA